MSDEDDELGGTDRTLKIAYLKAGPLIDYWVAMAAGYDPVYQPDSDEGPRVCISKCHDQGELVPVAPGVPAVD